MRIALIGYGLENQSAYRFFKKQTSAKHDITIHDQDQSILVPSDTDSVLGKNYLDDLDKYDIVIRTSGMHPRLILDKNPGIESKITTAINIFFENCHSPIIGVTGTKGKGTTSTLIHKILQESGKTSVLAGNIGDAALDNLDEANRSDYAILELSSFQLYDIKYSPKIAVCLMVVPEHLNWHENYDDYTNAKTNLFRHQKSEDTAIYYEDNEKSRDIANASISAKKISYGTINSSSNVNIKNNLIYFNDEEICPKNIIKLRGDHNLQNACAAIAATWDLINKDKKAISRALSEFTGLPFRIEFIREINGIKYFNDSFSTTPETAIAAIRSFNEPKIVILGGSDKGIPFDDLAKEVTINNVKRVIAIGQTGKKIYDLLTDLGYSSVSIDNLYTMENIITEANRYASKGDIVLLSTGSASFGMFKNYKDRGEQFNQVVRSLD